MKNNELKFKIGDKVNFVINNDDFCGWYTGVINTIDYRDNKKPYLVVITSGVAIWCSERVLKGVK